MARKPMTLNKLLSFVVLALLVAAVRYFMAPDPGIPGNTTRQEGVTVEEAASRRLSEVMLDAAGVVQRTLADDNEGSRHQRFILELASGHTVLVAHNIDLAPRVPLDGGDRVSIHGQYEWNDRGGVLHWTHHDPDGRHEGGWIEHRGKKYQ